ncbi:DUF4145 domain-containing protein [Bifidobacterium dolichotidis]|nr:DUF4145 domain-containing protein [Bifidobacterium dolichotidis]
MANRICWACGAHAHMSLVSSPQYSENSWTSNYPSGIWSGLFQCDSCKKCSIGSIHNSKLNDPKDVADLMNTNDVTMLWHPQSAIWKEFADVPDPIAKAASEANACLSIGAYRAAILMARTVIEATATDKGIGRGTLVHKIDELESRGILSDQIKQEAHEIRYLGNDVAHGGFSEPVSEEEATDILGFLDTFLDYVYQMPLAIQRRKESRKQRRESAQNI